MKLRYKNPVPYLFYGLFFLIPLIFSSKTSELFEFNKMVLTYGFTLLIVTFWVIKMFLERKITFRRTILDIPLLIFLGSQILSTLVSFDTHTSIFGYYSRFHGGLISSISYALLYWAYVSNMDKERTKMSLFWFFSSAAIASIWGIFEHFGASFSCLLFTGQFNVECWVQDVQNRVFATLGQPNWLAAFLVALIPLTWYFSIKKQAKKVIFITLSSIFFLTLLYTKSRSGILGFGLSFIAFSAGIGYLYKSKEKLRSLIKSFGAITAIFALITLLVGTPWTPSLNQLLKKNNEAVPQKPQGPALEVGGTESGEIRKIVWDGAIDIWKNYPILGTGVETFAYSYYNFRPEEHNLVSEWDFLYNKAHNEYLNIAATTGSVGLISYFILISFSLFLFSKRIYRKKSLFSLSLLAGYISILATNFFGFSVVVVGLQFFLFPAMAASFDHEEKERLIEFGDIRKGQKIALILLSLLAFYMLFAIGRYWYADHLYNQGKIANDTGDPVAARQHLQTAIKISPNEAIYWDELSEASTDIAVALAEDNQEEKAQQFASLAIEESSKAVNLSPKNVNLKRSQANMYIKLSSVDTNYLIDAKQSLMQAITLAPTDAKLYYNLALAHTRVGETEDAIRVLEHTVDIKENYRNARYALALLLIDGGETEKAREQLRYILENINPEDKMVKEELETL